MFFRSMMLTLAAVVPVAGAGAAANASPKPANTIIAVAAGNPEFSTLVTAITAAGLVDALNGEGPFTVFAPTNAAFAALPAGTVEDLLKPINKAKLTAILTYHVIPGKIESAALTGKKLSSPATLQGGTVDIDGTNGVKVDGANVVVADVKASNGVIHVIDKVLLPGN